jgi:hypothetical protein
MNTTTTTTTTPTYVPKTPLAGTTPGLLNAPKKKDAPSHMYTYGGVVTRLVYSTINTPVTPLDHPIGCRPYNRHSGYIKPLP